MTKATIPKILTIGIGALIVSASAQAADTVHSSSTTGTVNWTAATWSPAVSDWTTTAGDVARYTGSTATTYTLDTDVTVGAVRDSAGGNGFTLLTDGTHVLNLDATGLSSTNQPFANAGVAAIAQANGNASASRVFTVGSTTTGVTVNMLTDLNVGITSGTGSAFIMYGTINNTSASAKTLTFLENSSSGSSGAPQLTINSAIGGSGSALAIINAGSSANATVTRGVTTLAGVLGSNVTTVTENSSSSALTLSGSNSYTGGTTVTLGLLTVTSTGSLGTGNVSLADTTGVTLTLQNNNAIADSAILNFGANSVINLNGTAGTSETVYGLYDVTTGTSIAAGTYTAAALNSAFGVTSFASTNGETVTVVTAVPEPGTYALVMGGMGLLTVWQRRRRLA
ncbi:MAG: PEP-CTERM sorting domain-containing protein [Chthoniobacteraceae bacterium]